MKAGFRINILIGKGRIARVLFIFMYKCELKPYGDFVGPFLSDYRITYTNLGIKSPCTHPGMGMS
jgi:hypothetical protein